MDCRRSDLFFIFQSGSLIFRLGQGCRRLVKRWRQKLGESHGTVIEKRRYDTVTDEPACRPRDFRPDCRSERSGRYQ